MNIFYDHTAFRQPYGGVSRYFREIITRLLDNKDVDIHLFMGLFANLYGLEKMKDRYAAYWGYSKPTIRYTSRLCNSMSELGWQLFQMRFAPIGGKGSVYHPTYYNFSGMPGAKVVFTVYDFTHERYPHLFPTSDKTRELKRKAFERSDALICISESTKNDLLSLYPSTKCDIKTIYLGYNDLSLLTQANLSLPAWPYFLFVGHRDKYKNFKCLLEVFALSSELKRDFGVICFGGAPFSDTEKRHLDELGVSGRVTRFEGGDDVLAALYKNAVAFVYPSLYEGFGIPILEAMSCDCPVVVSSASSIPEVAGDAALMFDPAPSESAEDLADKLRRVVADSGLRARLIESGRRRRNFFSWDRCAEETLALYSTL